MQQTEQWQQDGNGAERTVHRSDGGENDAVVQGIPLARGHAEGSRRPLGVSSVLLATLGTLFLGGSSVGVNHSAS